VKLKALRKEILSYALMLQTKRRDREYILLEIIFLARKAIKMMNKTQ